MKKLLFIIVMLTAFVSNAQIVIKEAPKDTVIWQATKLSNVPKMVRFEVEGEYSYTMYYKNAKYTAITDIDYLTTGDLETTKQFYELCKQVLAEDKEYNIEMDNKSIMIKKSMTTVMIWMSDSYFYLSEKNITSILEKLK
jgi:hypothetical protein